MNRFDHFFKPNKLRLRLVILGGIFLLALAALPQLKFNYDFSQLFPKNDREYAFFQELNERLNSQQDFLIIGIERGSTVFDSNFLAEIDDLTRKLEKLKHIHSVGSPTNARYPVFQFPLRMGSKKYLHHDKPEKYAKDSGLIYQSPLKGSLFSHDAKSIAIYLEADTLLNHQQGKELIEQMFGLTKVLAYPIHFEGRLYGELMFVQQEQTELVLFISSSLLLLLLILSFFYRQWVLVLAPLVVVVLAGVFQLAIMAILDIPITLITTILPTILFVVGMSDAIHIIEKYILLLRQKKGKRDALTITLREIGLATLLTSLTTAIGFASLISLNLQMVVEFGWLTALGVMLAYAVAILLLPTLLALLPPPGIAFKEKAANRWNGLLNRCHQFTLQRSRSVLILFGGFLMLAVFGFSQLKVDNYIMEDWGENHQHKRSYQFFQDNFAGYRSFDLALFSKEGSLMTLATMKKIQKLHDYLEKEMAITHIVSPLDLIKETERAMKGGNLRFFQLPKNEERFEECLEVLKTQGANRSLNHYLSQDESLAKLNGKMFDVGGRKMHQMVANLEHFADSLFQDSHIEYKVTGLPWMVDQLARKLSGKILIGLLIALLVVGLIVGLMFRNWRMVFIALLINALPLFLIAGYMGWVQIHIEVTTALIFTIAYGIAVDDTIHFLSRLKMELKKGLELEEALRQTLLGTGKAIIITSIILVGGFATLLLSQMQSTQLVGGLLSLTLLFAVLCDLILLPVLIRSFGGKALGNRI